MPKHSDLPEKIISILLSNSATPRKEISERLKVSYQSVQKHLLKMQNDGVVTPALLVNEGKVKKKRLFWIFISTTSPDAIKSKSKKRPDQHDDLGNDYQPRLCKEIEESFQVTSDLMSGLIFGGVHIVLGGDYDIILRIYADEPDSVGMYVTRFLRSRPAVVSTSTAWALSESTKK
jgi:DNA-binding Lrp family transcriptional regulator